jgi:hypothetical protein
MRSASQETKSMSSQERESWLLGSLALRMFIVMHTHIQGSQSVVFSRSLDCICISETCILQLSSVETHQDTALNS